MATDYQSAGYLKPQEKKENKRKLLFMWDSFVLADTLPCTRKTCPVLPPKRFSACDECPGELRGALAGRDFNETAHLTSVSCTSARCSSARPMRSAGDADCGPALQWLYESTARRPRPSFSSPAPRGRFGMRLCFSLHLQSSSAQPLLL